nr:6308_t:CDS:2 [Entrophospora candida]
MEYYRFLEKCGLESYYRKIESYITSLETIANIGESKKKRDKAQLLLNNYREISMSLSLLETQVACSSGVNAFEEPALAPPGYQSERPDHRIA